MNPPVERKASVLVIYFVQQSYECLGGRPRARRTGAPAGRTGGVSQHKY